MKSRIYHILVVLPGAIPNEFRLLDLVGGGGSGNEWDSFYQIFGLAVSVFRFECRYFESLGLSSEPFLLESLGEAALERLVVFGCEVEAEEVVGI